MARTMWKFELDPAREQQYGLAIPFAEPQHAHLGLQRGVPCLWIQVDDSSKPDRWLFQWTGTGHDREKAGVPYYAKYMGTVVMAEGALVLHGYLWRPE